MQYHIIKVWCKFMVTRLMNAFLINFTIVFIIVEIICCNWTYNKSNACGSKKSVILIIIYDLNKLWNLLLVSFLVATLPMMSDSQELVLIILDLSNRVYFFFLILLWTCNLKTAPWPSIVNSFIFFILIEAVVQSKFERTIYMREILWWCACFGHVG